MEFQKSIRFSRNILRYFLIIFYSIILFILHIHRILDEISYLWPSRFYMLCVINKSKRCNKGVINKSSNHYKWRTGKGYEEDKGKTYMYDYTKRPRSKQRWTEGIGEAYIRLCFIYPWIKDNIFILVPTTILRALDWR